jgi:ribosomal protein S18 acetylase RimI-like enzyme
MQLSYSQAQTKGELEQILALQAKNLIGKLSSSEKENEGFVTISHSLGILERMNLVCPHIIAKDNDKVVGYALCMHPKFSEALELLKPLFLELRAILPEDEKYVVMGQICIRKDYRRKGVFRKLYQTMKKAIHPEFKSIITEVDAENTRSLNAHYAVGFKLLTTHSESNREWNLIVLK